MQKRSAAVERARTVALETGQPRKVRWSMLGFALALALALAVGVSRASAATVPLYTCDRVLGRACTVTEELAYCMLTAMNSFDDCKDNGGFLNDVGCYNLYVADYYACYLTTPINVFIK